MPFVNDKYIREKVQVYWYLSNGPEFYQTLKRRREFLWKPRKLQFNP